ncbi:flagellar basal body-associated FliL family protein [Geomonas sp. RF6]|uniref:flagellar basal body-associated FliL family protein n=1 Tax=Geomonas sp. RF6 TaxID=2897342 RepID=UPI001E380D46|nr:flagellar basal body-associated FliL family protein [Geomonas sp. RF6]UFS72337.1 flagellar basal body-associated FliL family protein [Geomonas sp. RF6]
MAEQAKEQAPPPKDKKKLFIIIGAAVAVLLVIGVAAGFFMGGGKEKKGHGAEAKVEASEGGEAKAESKGEGGGHGGGGGEGKGAATNVYPLEPFIVNIYDGQEIRYLKLKVEFELATPEVKGELDAKQAPLRDAILVLLTTKTMQEIQDLQGKNQLREQILAAVGKIATPGKVTKVYFTDFVVQ